MNSVLFTLIRPETQRKKNKTKIKDETPKTATICTLESLMSPFVFVIMEIGGQEKRNCCVEVLFVSRWKMSVLPLNCIQRKQKQGWNLKRTIFYIVPGGKKSGASFRTQILLRKRQRKIWTIFFSKITFRLKWWAITREPWTTVSYDPCTITHRKIQWD